jgi:hypothetical protein
LSFFRGTYVKRNISININRQVTTQHKPMKSQYRYRVKISPKACRKSLTAKSPSFKVESVQ